MESQRVVVRQALRYLSPQLRAIEAKIGDVIAVLGGDYASGLVRNGFVELVVEETAVPETAVSETAAAPLPSSESPDSVELPLTQLPTDQHALRALPGVGAEIAEALENAGFATVAAIQAASDRELLHIPGIGKKTLSAIRAAVTAEGA